MKKNTYYLGGLLVVLVLVAYLVLQKPGEQSVSSGGSVLFTIDSLAVDKIELRSPSSVVTLERRGIDWFLQQPINYRADQANLAALIHQAKNMEVKNVASSKPEKRSVFQVDSTGTTVSVYERGVVKAAFVVGKPGMSYSETYVRATNSNDVVLVDGSLSYTFNRPIKEWRDKTIFTASRESIKEVRYQYGDTTFTLAWRDSTWRIGKDSAKAETVTSLLTTLSSLQTDDFVDSAITPTPKVTAQLTYGGVQIRFSLPKGSMKYYVQTSNSPQWFVLEQWRANDILKRRKDLLKSPA